MKNNNITIISRELSPETGQGVYVYAWEIFSGLKNKIKIKAIVSKIKSNSAIKKIIQEQIILPIKTIFSASPLYHSIAPEEGCWIPFIKKNTIVTIHDIIPITHNERSKLFRRYFEFCLKRALKSKRIISVSEYTKKELVKHFDVDEKKIKVIYHGFDPSKFSPKKNKKNKKIKIGYFGGLGKRKRIDVLIKAAKKLPKNTEIIIGGGGPEKKNIEKLIKKEKINNIKLLGYIPNKKVSKFYQNLDIFVFPSEFEGFGMPLIEAMACGLPVITSNTSSMPEIVGKAGICIKPGNSDLLAKTLNGLINNKNRIKELSKKSIARAKKFSWKKTCKEHLKIYEEFK